MLLPCEQIVYRVLRRKPLDESGRLEERDFLLKAGDVDDGLSVFTSRDAAEQCRHSLSKMDGLATLHVGKIRDLGQHLDVVEVAAEGFEGHAVISNLPNPFTGVEQEVTKAERLGRSLANMARLLAE